MARSAPVRIFKSHVKGTTFVQDFGGFASRRVINKTGSAIAADKLVAINGYDVTSKHPKIVLADADSLGLATDVFVTRSSISDGAKGTVYKGATSAATLNTNFGTVGDPVYLDTTAGAFTGTAPTGGSARQIIVGYTMVKSATIGQIRWDIKLPSLYGALDIQSGVDATVLTASGSISAANIVATGVGQLGHANGVVLVAAQGATKIVEFVYALIEMDFLTAAYTGGGATAIKLEAGGVQLSNSVPAATFIQAAADVSAELNPPGTSTWTTANIYPLNKGINLVSASAPTNPGTAAGVIKWTVGYRVLTSQLD